MLTSAGLKNKLATFGQCQLDCNSGYLTVAGNHQKLEPLVFQFLLLLIRQQGEVVSKKMVLDSLWPDRSPTDEALRAMVKKAREALKDDARNPSYIKTIPTKGYLLIPNVELTSTIVISWFNKNRKLLILAGLLVTLLVLVVDLVFFGKSQQQIDADKIRLRKTEIGQLNGYEVSTHHMFGSIKNIYLARNIQNILNTIIVEDIANKEQLSLVFSGAEIGDFWWSRNSNRLVVTRTDSPGFYLVQFREQGNKQAQITFQNIALPEDYKGIALNHMGTQLFVVHTATSTLSRFNLDAGELTDVGSINSFVSDLASNEVEQVDAPVLANNTDLSVMPRTSEIVGVWPAPSNGHFIVVLHYKDNAHLLLVDAQNKDNIVAQQKIPFGIREGVWDRESKKFSFTDELGGLFSYQIAQNKITSWNTGGELVNGLIADCNDNCFIVANTQGLPKLATLANPFNTNSTYAKIISSNRQTRSESLPIFSQNGIYFIAQSESGYNLMFRATDETESIVYSFGIQDRVSELVLSTSEEIIVGVLNERPFSFNLMTQKFAYLNIKFPSASMFMFDAQDRLTFYASPANQASGRYAYDLINNDIALNSEGRKLDFPLTLDVTDNGVETQIKARFELSEKDQASIVYKNEKSPVALSKLTHDCIQCFHIHQNHLYYIDNERLANIVRVNLVTGEETKEALLIPDVIRHISLSPDGRKIALTIRQNLQTNLTKIEGFKQIY